ncbi:YopX family protein [Bacillus mobilis]|uniref:YopX family protein n=1 Tax=Bacillus mobilis TaxID=2026190 RepID=UPI003CF70C6D
MKEVEFRAWDLKDKRMYHKVGIVGTLIILEHDQSGYEFSELDLKSYDDIDNNYDLMQYTGMKDKNDEKIFEGDIVNFLHPLGFYDKSVIVWEEKKAQFKIVPLSVYKINAGNGKWTGFPLYRSQTEVIGNIYEEQN